MGNIYGIIGMCVAFITAIISKCCDFLNAPTSSDALDRNEILYLLVGYLSCLIPAACIGIFIASRVEMVQMPQLVAGFHSFVGLAAVFVGFAHWIKDASSYQQVHELKTNEEKEEANIMHLTMIGLETVLGIFIGGMTFTGSLVAFGKLQGIIRSKPLIIGGNFRHVLNAGLVIFGCLLCIPYIASEVIVMNDIPVFGDTVSITDIQKYSVYFNAGILILVTLISFFIGWHMVMAIGGADMPVVVSMLNSYSGWATAASGFLLNNYAMIVGGALIGSSGAILSYIMCKAMNRSFMSVIFGGFGATPSKTRNQEDEGP
ncbi:NAD(P) transhydrogenase subunit alpha, putative, partial [Entamoeba histolytica KU27]